MLLSRSSRDRMWARPPVTCPECRALCRWNYCRDHDEFFLDGHVTGCSHAEHVGHRVYGPRTPLNDTPLAEWPEEELTRHRNLS